MATEFKFVDVDTKQDESPPLSDDYSPEAPYGYKADGTPYKRRPNGAKSGGGSGKRMPASESLARSAAGVLATGNNLFALGVLVGGFPKTGGLIKENNPQFEELAYQALLTDPALCRKILSGGATSGKLGLAIAYLILIGSTVPVARDELRERRIKSLEERENNGNPAE